MQQKPCRRRRLLLVLFVMTVCIALYLIGGFFVAPAVFEAQLERRVTAWLDQRLTVDDVRFNPLTFRLEIDGLVLGSRAGVPLGGFSHFVADLELRSLVDRRWTFGEASLRAPFVHAVRTTEGWDNYTDVLQRLNGNSSAPSDGGLPPFAVERLRIDGGRLEMLDRRFDDSTVIQIQSLDLSIDGLSNRSGPPASYTLSAVTATGAELKAKGSLHLAPLTVRGSAALVKLPLHTLVRVMAHRLAVTEPPGALSVAGHFDIGAGEGAGLTGSVEGLELSVQGLLLMQPGASEPLLALQTLALHQGRIDFDGHEASAGHLRVAGGRLSAALDGSGILTWASLVQPVGPTRAPDQGTGAKDVAAPLSNSAVPAAPAPALALNEQPSLGGASAARSRPWRISVGSIELESIGVALDDVSRSRQVRIGTLDVRTSARVRLSDGPDFTLGETSVRLEDAKVDLSSASYRVPELTMEAEQATLTAVGKGFEVGLQTPRIEALEGMSGVVGLLKVKAGEATLGAEKLEVMDVTTSPRVVFALPRFSVSDLSFGEKAPLLSASKLTLDGTRLEFRSGQPLEVHLDRPRTTTARLIVQQGPFDFEARAADLAADRLTISGGATHGWQGTARAPRLDASDMRMRQGSERIDVAHLTAQAGRVSTEYGESGSGARLCTQASQAALELATLTLRPPGATMARARIGAARLGADRLSVAASGAPPDFTGSGLSGSISDVRVTGSTDAASALSIDHAMLAGGMLRLHERIARAERVAVNNGSLIVEVDAQGNLVLPGVFASAGASGAAPFAPGASAGRSEDMNRWDMSVDRASVEDFAVRVSSRSASPQWTVSLDSVQAQVFSFDTASGTPARLEMQAHLSSGGTLSAQGLFDVSAPSADLTVDLRDLSLAPLQPYLAEVAKLQILSGSATAKGRLRFGATDAMLRYEGSAAIQNLSLLEPGTPEPLLGWSQLQTEGLLLQLAPNQIEIDDLRLEGPVGRVVIDANSKLNVMDLLEGARGNHRPRLPNGMSGPVQQTSPSESVIRAKGSGAAFPVTVQRLAVSDGVLNFADRSLSTTFSTKMHKLRGVITGLGTDPTRSAKVQLDAQVDQYGAAQIRGELAFFHPRDNTQVDVSFRNIPLTSLSPYAAKFAGYRIVDGRLALDVHYSIENAKLEGRNQIVLRQVKLGEKVDGPSVLDIPIKLALAVLKDAKGVIDIALPVTGNLDDPQFDYGQVIRNAIGRLLGRIVSAPFRALGAMFGRSNDDAQLGQIEFEPGSVELAPPEREKLDTVARALSERPGLRLVVQPTYIATKDAPALRERAIRAEVARRMGFDVRSGTDPGPIDTADPRVQRAIQSIFNEHYAPGVLNALTRRAGNATPEFYQGLVERLVAEHSLDDAEMRRLAERRGLAIVDGLKGSTGLDSQRFRLAETQSATGKGGRAVALDLQLEVAP